MTTSDRDLIARLSSHRACGGAICTGAFHSSGFVKVAAAVRVKVVEQVKVYFCTYCICMCTHV